MKKLDGNALRGCRRRSTVSADDVTIERLYPDSPFPMLVRPKANGVRLAEWGARNRERLERMFHEHRSLLFRGFDSGGIEGFGDFVAATSEGEPLPYRDRSTPRRAYGTNVYCTTVFLPEHRIRLHNEGSYWLAWARKAFFGCITAPPIGPAAHPASPTTEATAGPSVPRCTNELNHSASVQVDLEIDVLLEPPQGHLGLGVGQPLVTERQGLAQGKPGDRRVKLHGGAIPSWPLKGHGIKNSPVEVDPLGHHARGEPNGRTEGLEGRCSHPGAHLLGRLPLTTPPATILTHVVDLENAGWHLPQARASRSIVQINPVEDHNGTQARPEPNPVAPCGVQTVEHHGHRVKAHRANHRVALVGFG